MVVLQPTWSTGGTKLSLEALVLGVPFVFLLICGDDCGRKKEPSNLLFEMMMVLEKELPTWSHRALPRSVWCIVSSVRAQIH